MALTSIYTLSTSPILFTVSRRPQVSPQMITRCSAYTVIRLPSCRTTSHIARAFPKSKSLRSIGFVRNYVSPAAQVQSTVAISAGIAAATASGGSVLYPLDQLVNELDEIGPRFAIDAENIEILEGPVEFYGTLKAKIAKAQRRVYLSTLYIGKTEHELISTIRDALRHNPALQVSVLTDALRGTREAPGPTCASLLAPLIAEFGSERVEVRLYHTPNLTGLRKRIIPKRINEGWGLQHMKLYGVDDEIIMSGANLSSDYFTNRQDRYHVFRSKALTDYYALIHRAVCDISFAVEPSDTEAGFLSTWPTSNPGPSPLTDAKGYISHAASLISSLVVPPPSTTNSKTSSKGDTVVYPLFQLTPLLRGSTYSSTEMRSLHHILASLRSAPLNGSRLTFTAGYFNPTSQLTSLLLSNLGFPKFGMQLDKRTSTQNPALTVIAASPWANGFYGSAGVSGMLPAAYTLLCRRFLAEVNHRGLSSQVKLLEWRRGTVGDPEAWTYHAKGLWITLPSETYTTAATVAPEPGTEQMPMYEPGPSICLVGSSNYTARSTTLDLEANALIVTRNKDLQRRLAEEERWLGKYAKEVGMEEYTSSERRVGLHVRIAMWIVGLVGGAL